ncbi:class I adenylate-forming enzyme family protein [Desertibacillus haloalkaliphilus]|uniref:class I adenylate-forming enzyme family protein n=1 Tax=Desertibacillus haloalkaliphilus TaxID=1328930 RepID=UPI001C26A6D2|nr:long-chain-fatty-acid--CoA ligase [Desertibacillus haloalkaliphilus]MBU8908299.1 long-chain-fatty-acid--CoA ligase [Desertibacillus haloalkaliphilus]
MNNKDPQSITQLFESASSRGPTKEIVFDQYQRMTYQDVWNDSLTLAAALREQNVSKGDKVAVCLPNWNEFVVIYMAIAHLGAIMVPFNTRYKSEEVEYILNNSGAKVAFFTKEFSGVNHFEQFKQASQTCEQLEKLFTVRFKDNDHLSYEDLLTTGQNKTFSPVAIDPKEDVFTILYTSGSTGAPKGAMLTHANVVSTAVITAEEMKCTSDDVFLVAVPVFHVFGMVPSILTTIASGARMVFMDQYKAKEALKIIEDEGITIKHGVPTMFVLELNHPEFKNYNLSTLRTGLIAAAPCPVEVVKRIRSDMGCNIIVAYGLSETSPTLTMTSFNDNDLVRSETVGKALPGAEIKIVNEQREEVNVGEVGELACRSFGVMKGYYNMPEKTKEALDNDGWFYSGDLATMDNHGYIRIVGRKKEMIIRGGYNIYPREVEEVFYTHPNVMEVAIVGLPDTVLGEISCACIKLKAEDDTDEKSLLDFIKTKVADYKVPDKVLVVDEFPMTASGKIKKIELQKQLKEKLTTELR